MMFRYLSRRATVSVPGSAYSTESPDPEPVVFPRLQGRRCVVRMACVLMAACILWPQAYYPVHLATAHTPGAHLKADCQDHCDHGQPQKPADAGLEANAETTRHAGRATHCILCVTFKMSGGQKYDCLHGDNGNVISVAHPVIPECVFLSAGIDTLSLYGPRAPPPAVVS